MVILPEPLGCQSKPECGKTPKEAAGYSSTFPSMFSWKKKSQSPQNSLSGSVEQDKTRGLEIYVCKKNASTSVSSQASIEFLSGSAEIWILLTFCWPRLRNVSGLCPVIRQRLLETCTCAYNTWDVQELNAKSNLPEHTVQRGKVDERRDGGGENREKHHVFVFTVHQWVRELKHNPKACRQSLNQTDGGEMI